ncbi:MAG: 4-hydroxy-3-methylbut-2-en-1-yl diphosphate synthase [Candidatus Makaraimicrobium thalassicum]|nr:MAG: 4-hydroxy-3-methylbut-2-en-1-yl diphosphate synthase [Candidatus Omnitrophota bacterium]
MIQRRKTRTVTVGSVKIGSGHPVAIQSMTKTDTLDVDATVRQIRGLEKEGCELVRVAVREPESARAISRIKSGIHIPIIADIHFDHKLALEAITHGADKIRINPGNITNPAHIDRIIDSASEKGIPVRLGVNSGSLPDAGAAASPAGAMVSPLLRYLEHFRRRDFNDIVISLKSSSVSATVEAYRRMAAECDYPFHLGITATGTPAWGIVRSSVGIGALLLDGIGDTIRVSLTGDPDVEVDTARRILVSAGVRHFGPEIISCPTCGRCQVDLVPMVRELEDELGLDAGEGSRKAKGEGPGAKSPLVIAVMGCEVNGPGEAKNADIGVAFGRGRGVVFRKGRIVKTVEASNAVRELAAMVRKEEDEA